MKTKSLRLTAFLLVVMMLVGLMPTAVFAASNTTNSFKASQLSVITDKASTLANGVTQNAYTVYDKKGDQVKMYVTTADLSVDTVKLYASYKDMNPKSFGMSKLTEQVASFNAKVAAGDGYYQGTAVAGINASYYNMTTGQPSGIFVMNGVVGNAGEGAGYFAVMKDGSVKIGVKGDYAKDKNNIQEAIGIYTMLIVDGEICSGLDASQKYPRQTIGITADNKVILMTADGNQAPTTIGLTVQEQAQVMQDLGCVWAGHLDGGGSTTYACKPEGSDKFVITNSPSDGSERSISNGFIIASTEAASYTFDHAVFNVKDEYVTPGTSTEVSVGGVSSTGNSADLPDGITYEVTNGTYVDGVFTAGDEAADAVITAMYNGEAVGNATIHAVIPETFNFDQKTITIPYGKTVAVSFIATYGLNTVAVKASDVVFNIDNVDAAAINGFDITACDESAGATGAKITATLTCADLEATANLAFGKGSEVIEGFEDFSIPSSWTIKTGYPQYGPAGANGQNEKGSLEVVTAENGKVRNGNNALAVHVDMSQLYEIGYHLLNFKLGKNSFRIPANATAFGFWMYVPEDTNALYARWNMDTVGDGKADYTPDFFPTGLASTYAEPGWHYYSVDLSKYSTDVDAYMIQLYVSDRDGADYNYYFKNQYSVDSKFTLYIDDFTVDYSSVIDDREAPIFTGVSYADGSMADAVALNGQTVTNNLVSFGASVHEDTAKNNYTGIDDTSAKAYIDGVPVDFTYAGGTFAIQDAELADGVHTVAFEIADMMGNTARVSRKITVAANSGKTYVNLVPQTPNANKILIGSVQWYDLKTNAIENIDSITTVLNLNSVSNWELEGMTVAAGFEASYVIDEITNDATITITKKDNNATGEAVIASIPVRTWISTITNDPGYEASTPASLWSRKIIWPKDIKISADYGLITYADGTTGTFSSDRYQTITELYGNYAALNANGDYANKKSWHVHTAETMADKAATCTENGYTGRTYCEVCKSVVDWGTTVPATGHNYAVVDGALKCTACGELCNGEYEGKTYVDGVVAEGWTNDSYYVDGVKLTGVQAVNGIYYDFGEDGVCEGQTKYRGLLEIDGSYYCLADGKFVNHWQYIDGNYYYFHTSTNKAATGTTWVMVAANTVIDYEFDNTGKLISGVWKKDANGSKYFYGPYFYYASSASVYHGIAWREIDGKTYGFNKDGYRYEGLCLIGESNSGYSLYEFTKDGELVGKYTGKETGLITCSDGNRYYVKNGEPVHAGLVQVDGDYYYINSYCMPQTGEKYVNVYFANGLVPAGTYNFDEDGKMVIKREIINENGKLSYYVNGEKTYAGLIEIDGNYYYVNSSCEVVTQKHYWVLKTNDLMPAGFYDFDEEGKMIQPKNGIVEEDGVKYYYVNGEKTYVGLIKDGNDYYYFNSSCKAVTQKHYWVLKANDLMPAGFYDFDEEGKMIQPKNGIVEEDGVKYYYVNDEKTYAGLIKDGNDYYYFNSSCKAVTQKHYWVLKTNDLMPAGFYDFDEEGKMIQPKNGIVEEDGVKYYYVNDEKTYAGLIEMDGDIYYVNSSFKVVTGKYWVVKTNGLIEASGYYMFDADGKMVR